LTATRPSGFVNGDTFVPSAPLKAQVCIVGSGAGGAVSAAVLAAAGLDVLVLEEGGHHTRTEFRMREDAAYPMLYQEDAGRTTEDLSIAILQGRSVGGSTTINWTTCFRTPEHVIDHWAAIHDVKGFTFAELGPHWDEVEKRLSIAPIRLEEINRNNRTLWDGCKALGYDVALIRRNVKNCMKSGYCGLGCPVDAKQSMLVTYLPDAVAHGATVLSHCRVDRIEGAAGGQLIHGTLLGADGRTPTGQSVTVNADHLILSGGAINTPALLLRSGFRGNGLVGRRTYLHPTTAQFGLYREPIQGFYGAPQSVASHHFARRGDEVGYFLESAPVHPMLGAMASPGFGETHRETMSRLGHAAAHIALHIDGFHPDEPGGRVKVRASGAPILDYRIPKRIFTAMRESFKTLARVQLASGATETRTSHDPNFSIRSEADLKTIDSMPYEPNRLLVFSAHVMGGSAMSDDPGRGVVRSADCAVHGLPGVHVIDGSLFPTSLGVNPQLTIYGLAHLMATRLAEQWKSA
jgi:choline dehydrogenase-like flavoprotein